MRIIICGGGIIGATTAFFLSQRGAVVTVVERCALACGASGKGGGFLALDWCDGSPVGPLARRSFQLHADLAQRLCADWGYRKIDTYAGAVGSDDGGHGRRPGLAWVGEPVRIRGKLNAPGTTAQLHPARFTETMMAAAQDHGARMIKGTVTGIERSRGGTVSVTVGGERLEADAVIIAMGPWSQLARAWLNSPSVYGLKGHSIVYRTGAAVPPEALFLDFARTGRESYTPEIFPRPDGTTYVCAISSAAPLPVDPAKVEPDPGAMDELHALATTISPAFAESPIVARQACFRPVTADNLPVIGALATHPGIFMATGHGPWGILNAPATAEALTELVLDGEAQSVSLAAFDPARFAEVR